MNGAAERTAVIVDAVRSPIARAYKGSLAGVRPDDLAGRVIAALLARNGAVEADGIDEVITGCGYPWGEQGYNVSRAAALLGGLPTSVPAHTVSRLCASSLQAIRAAHHAILAGEGDTYIACGVESVSRVGRDSHLAVRNPRLDPTLPGPTVANLAVTMLETAERVAVDFDVTRPEMDRFAQRSQERAVEAAASGFFAREIVPIPYGDGAVLTADEGPRPSSSLDKLAALEPVLPGGVVTAGNACPLNDGAAAVLVMSARRAADLGLTPRARILGSAVAAVDPTLMGVGPIEAIRAVLALTGLSVADLGVIELNEAFAAQVIPVLRAVGIDPHDDRVNPHGGAIALGHPFGMTGARMMTTLLNGLDAADATIGLETMCVGGGQGQAMLVERLA